MQITSTYAYSTLVAGRHHRKEPGGGGRGVRPVLSLQRDLGDGLPGDVEAPGGRARVQVGNSGPEGRLAGRAETAVHGEHEPGSNCDPGLTPFFHLFLLPAGDARGLAGHGAAGADVPKLEAQRLSLPRQRACDRRVPVPRLRGHVRQLPDTGEAGLRFLIINDVRAGDKCT